MTHTGFTLQHHSDTTHSQILYAHRQYIHTDYVHHKYTIYIHTYRYSLTHRGKEQSKIQMHPNALIISAKPERSSAILKR